MPSKPLVDEIRGIVDRKVSEILAREGPGAEISMEKIMEAFSSWVLPDHHLDAIRERIEYWKHRQK